MLLLLLLLLLLLGCWVPKSDNINDSNGISTRKSKYILEPVGRHSTICYKPRHSHDKKNNKKQLKRSQWIDEKLQKELEKKLGCIQTNSGHFELYTEMKKNGSTFRSDPEWVNRKELGHGWHDWGECKGGPWGTSTRYIHCLAFVCCVNAKSPVLYGTSIPGDKQHSYKYQVNLESDFIICHMVKPRSGVKASPESQLIMYHEVLHVENKRKLFFIPLSWLTGTAIFVPDIEPPPVLKKSKNKILFRVSKTHVLQVKSRVIWAEVFCEIIAKFRTDNNLVNYNEDEHESDDNEDVEDKSDDEDVNEDDDSDIS